MKGPNNFASPTAHKNSKIMIVKIQISDSVYTQLLNGKKRIQGTLALANPTEGNFNEHRRDWRPKPGTRYMRLPHGRVTVNEEQVRMNLHIRRDESIIPARAIVAESSIASEFIEFMEEDLV